MIKRRERNNDGQGVRGPELKELHVDNTERPKLGQQDAVEGQQERLVVRLALRCPCVVAKLPHGSPRRVRHRECQAATRLLRVEINVVDLQSSKAGVVLAGSTGAHCVSGGLICRGRGASNRRSTITVDGLLRDSCGGCFRGSRARVPRAAAGGRRRQWGRKSDSARGFSFVVGCCCVLLLGLVLLLWFRWLLAR